MKKSPGRKVVLYLLMVLLLTPLLILHNVSVAYAASPTFVESKVEIIGAGETYQLEIKNKVDGSTYKWSSSNTKVARVSSKGLVTAVAKGTADIRCIITLPTKKTATITCKVTVIIPATSLKINNAKEVNGAHLMKIGETYNFNRDIVPSNSSDKTYWSIGRGDKTCIQITDISSGIVKALKPGKVILVATAARTATEADAQKSIVNDAIIIEVLAPTANVSSVDIVDSTIIKAVFDSPIDEKTVIGQNGSLSDNIDLTLKGNSKGVSASDPGKLTAKLSTDKKTLTITSVNRFEGEYGINFSEKIKTTDGTAIKSFYKLISYVDSVPPDILAVTMDESGVIATITFTEAIDFSGFNVTGGGVLAGTGAPAADRSTVSFLNNKNNYIISEDKKSLTINLSTIAYTDFNKILTVTLTGIKDLSGLTPLNYTLTAILRPDNTYKPQAKLIDIVRTSYYTLTATFDRSLKSGGYATIANGSTMLGVVDSKDLKKVTYTLNEIDAARTGVQTVSVSSWQAYNVNPTDTSSYQQQSKSVSFDVDKSNPILLTEEFDPNTNILTLTYNKDVALVTNSGIFVATLVTYADEIKPNNTVTYTSIPSDNPKVVKLQMGNMSILGTYTFTLEQNFIRDTFKNPGLPRTVSISTSGGVAYELPGPYLVTQSTTNSNLIYLEFMNMLDVTSAEDIRNYSIPGVVITGAKVIKNTKADGSTVALTIAEGSIDITLERPIIINGVKDYSGNYAPISDFRMNVLLKDNVRPYFIDPPVYDKNRNKEIRFTFSEDIKGSMIVKVTQIGTYNFEIPNTVTISGSNVIINLANAPTQNAALKIDIIENKIVDMNENQVAPMNSQFVVVAYY